VIPALRVVSRKTAHPEKPRIKPVTVLKSVVQAGEKERNHSARKFRSRIKK
jgi:hypothetical protein